MYCFGRPASLAVTASAVRDDLRLKQVMMRPSASGAVCTERLVLGFNSAPQPSTADVYTIWALLYRVAKCTTVFDATEQGRKSLYLNDFCKTEALHFATAIRPTL